MDERKMIFALWASIGFVGIKLVSKQFHSQWTEGEMFHLGLPTGTSLVGPVWCGGAPAKLRALSLLAVSSQSGFNLCNPPLKSGHTHAETPALPQARRLANGQLPAFRF